MAVSWDGSRERKEEEMPPVVVGEVDNAGGIDACGIDAPAKRSVGVFE